MCIAKCH